MSKQNRILLQLLLWLILAMIMGTSQFGKWVFILEAFGIFVAQSIFTIVTVIYLVPKLLFKKKLVQFIILGSILTIGIAFLIIIIFPLPEIPNLMLENMRPGPRKPSRYLNHTLMLGFSFILATVVESVNFAMEKEKETIQNKNEQLQTELKLLKSQINPHFLFNALNNIYSLSVTNSPKTQQSISHLSNMLRYVLYDCEQHLVSIHKEVSYIENYIKLFSLKSSKPLAITTNISLENNSVQLSPMLFIPFIENAFKHSSIEKEKDSFIDIYLTATTATVHFSIQNSFPNSPKEKDMVGGIGLENVKKRLAILYPEKHQLYINTTNGVFDVNLTLKLPNNV